MTTEQVRPVFLAHPGARLLLFVTLVIWFAVESGQAGQRRPEATSQDRGSVIDPHPENRYSGKVKNERSVIS